MAQAKKIVLSKQMEIHNLASILQNTPLWQELEMRPDLIVHAVLCAIRIGGYKIEKIAHGVSVDTCLEKEEVA
jgi:hypothetical protein